MVLNIVLYRIFGFIGPAIATLIVAVVYTWLILRKSIKLLDTKWTKVFNLKEVGVLVISLIVFWTLGVLINNTLIKLNVHKYLSMIISMGIYGLCLFVLHFKKVFGILKKINGFRL